MMDLAFIPRKHEITARQGCSALCTLKSSFVQMVVTQAPNLRSMSLPVRITRSIIGRVGIYL